MPTVIAISETKIDASFPNVQFLVDDYFNTGDFRKDRIIHVGGLTIYIRKGTAKVCNSTKRVTWKAFASRLQSIKENG